MKILAISDLHTTGLKGLDRYVRDCALVLVAGDFTEHGHFILICGIDENDQLTIRDPNSWRNTQQTWDAQRVLDQHRNIWGFTYDG